ncbi:T9SS type A sorting domain-containing protein [Algibacter sp.]|nr:T9SS type A sorting domain-containing protein [Algibacter sp.]
MKQIYLITIISLLNLNFINAQTVTIDDPRLGAAATFTFTYVTSFTIGTSTSTPNIIYLTLPSGFNFSQSTGGANNMDPYVTFKVDGTSYLCSDTFSVGGNNGTILQLSTGGASTGITISSGSTIEIIVSNLMTNPSTADSYTFNWKTAESSGTATENFSATIDYSTLSTEDLTLNSKNINIYPNPSSDFIQISGLTKTEKYILYNTIGTTINSGNISENEKIDIKNLTNGLYFLKFENGNTLKFLKD